MDKEVKKISKKEIISEVGKICGMGQYRVKSVFDGLERVLDEHIHEATEELDIEIRPLQGMIFTSTHEPETTHNFLGKDIVVSERIKPKAMFTRAYVDRLNKK